MCGLRLYIYLNIYVSITHNYMYVGRHDEGHTSVLYSTRQNEVRVPDLKSGPSLSPLERSEADFDMQFWIRSGHGPGGVRLHMLGVILASTDIIHAC